MSVSGRAESAARQAHRSDLAEHAARAGLVAYAIVYLMVGWLAVQLALGDREGSPSATGALRELAQQPFGSALLWTVSIGLFLLAAWQLLEAAAGHYDSHGSKRTGKRLVSLGKAIVYAALGVSGVRVALGAGSSGHGEETMTARLMNLPGGELIVAAVGLGIIGFGLHEVYRAWTDKFAEQLDHEGRSGKAGTAYLTFGKLGYTARGIAFALVGGLFLYAAVTHDPQKSGGLDQAMLQLLHQPFGPVMLCSIGVGLACYGLFTLAQARHLSR